MGATAPRVYPWGSIVDFVDRRSYGWTTQGVAYADLRPARFDRDVDLHVVVSERPIISKEEEVIHGIAGYLTGVSLVTTSRYVVERPHLVRGTTAHEVAHSLGFPTYDYTEYPDESVLEDVDDPMHCDEKSCVLSSWSAAKDFCGDCQCNMIDLAITNTGILRRTREVNNGISLDGVTDALIIEEYRKQGITFPRAA